MKMNRSVGVMVFVLFSTTLISGNVGALEKYQRASQAADERAEFNEADFDFIRSAAELDQHLSAMDRKGSPLAALSERGLRTFISSLHFGMHGLGSFNSEVLELELTPVQSYAILALFGHEDAVFRLNHSRTPTLLDVELNSFCWIRGVGEDAVHSRLFGCDDSGPYVTGICFGIGTCKNEAGYTCHPPSCL